MQLSDVVEAVQARASYLRCATEAPADEGWIRCHDLIADPALLRREIEATAPGRGTDDMQVATSLYVQSYAFRLPSIAVAAYALGLPGPTVSPAETAIRIGRHRPAELAVTDPATSLDRAEDLVARLVGDHLEPFVATAHEAVRVGPRLLWGNVAASLATIFRAAQGDAPCGDAAVRDRADAFFAAAEPWLGGLGEWSTLEVPGALGWYWTRTSCCLWYQTDSGFTCDDCSLHEPAELAKRRQAELTAGPS